MREERASGRLRAGVEPAARAPAEESDMDTCDDEATRDALPPSDQSLRR